MVKIVDSRGHSLDSDEKQTKADQEAFVVHAGDRLDNLRFRVSMLAVEAHTVHQVYDPLEEACKCMDKACMLYSMHTAYKFIKEPKIPAFNNSEEYLFVTKRDLEMFVGSYSSALLKYNLGNLMGPIMDTVLFLRIEEEALKEVGVKLKVVKT